MRITGDARELHDLFYNLELVAPGKGEAKKTVSLGKIFLDIDSFAIHGLATDDIISIYGNVMIQESPASEMSYGFIEPSMLRDYRIQLGKAKGVQTIDLPLEPEDEEFMELFWHGHVLESIHGEAGAVVRSQVLLSPDKLRKFSLLEPRGEYPVKYDFVEWADRDIVRWTYGPNYSGVLAILDEKE